MTRRLAVAACALIALTAGASSPPDSIPLDVPKAHLYVQEADEKTMLADVNRLRASEGVKALRVDLDLVALARTYARTMFNAGYFGHRDPLGHMPVDRMRAAKIAFRTAGENISFAPDETTSETGFEASPGHRRNMLNPSFSRVGIGVIADSIYGSIFVQEFAGD
jgi:uncharacterized protein YkwD